MLSPAIAAAEAASAAFADWSALGPNARRSLLNAAAAELEARADAFVEPWPPARSSQPEPSRDAGAGTGAREAAALTTQITGEVIPSDKPGLLSLALREPVGVILGIAPWNAPVIFGCRAVASPLACGNTVILKASERCPRTHGLIVDAFKAAGFPNGVVNLVTNEPDHAAEVVGALIDHPAVRRINFTGSTAVGKIIASWLRSI